MKILIAQPNNPQCVAFWDTHAFRMVQILLEQRPHILGALEKSCVEDSTLLIVKLMHHFPLRMDMVLRIFDVHNTYYSGSRSNYQNFLGLPELRINALKIFAENAGFERICEQYCPFDGRWPPTPEMLIIMRALKDAGAAAPREICAGLEKFVVTHLLSMSEEQLKKESTDHMSHMITLLISPKNSAMSKDARYQFWLQHTLKMMNCSSIVLKLYAWDQVNDIIREALATKPHPLEYIVRQAGTPIVNGSYVACFGAGETPKYVKAEGSPPGGPELTLFRCTMRSKMKWWFLSEADQDKPGTDKDIDYYQHKSNSDEQEREPPLTGWSLTGNPSPGLFPAPLLESRGTFIPEPDVSLDEFLISKIPVWVQERGVLSAVFGTTMHRELILRSQKLLIFLADIDALTEAHLRSIWKAGMLSHDSEVADEIQSLLGTLSLHLDNTLYATLMDLLTTALRSDEGGREGREHRFSKVVVFVEKFHRQYSRLLHQLPASSGILFLNLIWALYRHPLSETSKSQPVVEEMLSLCLNETWNGGNVIAYITECTEQLHSFAALPDKEVDEARVSRILQSLIFMLSHDSSRGADTNLATHGVSEILHAELIRFVNAQRVPCLERKKGDVAWYKTQLSKRVHLIRVFYGLSSAISMTREQIDDMWSLLSHSTEREELFVFFKEAGVRTSATESAFVLADCMYVFKNMICSADVDWTSSTEGMYDSFITYSDGMKKSHADDELVSLAQETIWRITLLTPLDVVANKAIIYLLKSFSSYDIDSNNRLLDRVFSNLKEIDEKAREAGDVPLSKSDIRRVSRCVSILSNAITDGSGAVQVPHITRGCMDRICISVTCRIQPAYYDARVQKKPAEQLISVYMHPMSSLLALKVKICSFIEGAKPDRVYLNFGDTRYVSPDSAQISSLGIVDGSEVVASLNMNNYSSSVPYNDEFDEFKKDNGYHIGNLISLHSLYFEVLFSLLDRFTTGSVSADDVSSDTDIGKSIWKIMMEIPTRPTLLTSVIECSSGLPPASSDAWDQLLRTPTNTGSASMTYLLQIVDGLIQPGVEIPDEQVSMQSFVESGGFSAVLAFFLSNPKGERTEFRKTSDMIALHVIHFCLFGSNDNADSATELIAEVNSSAIDMVQTLLSTANFSAESGHTGSVQDALFTLTYLLTSPDIAEQLTSNPQARSLMTSVLRHESKKVRDMAADFAVRVGKSQKVVFDWLLAEVEGMSTSEANCDEIFGAFRILLIEQQFTLKGTPQLNALAIILSNKLTKYPPSEAKSNYPAMLVGCLHLLKSLIDIDVAALDGTDLGKDLSKIFLSKFLFAMPTPEVENSALCVCPQSRKATFTALVAFLNQRPEDYPAVLDQLHKLMELSAVQLRHTWGVVSYHDHKRNAKVGFTGLKNQGCTCYSNALLQQLFMNVPFRKAIMETPLRSSHRCSLWHMKDEDLVGKEMLLEWEGNVWHRAHVTRFDRTAGLHAIRYRDLNGDFLHSDTELLFNIRGGASRIKKETGRVKLFAEPFPGEEPPAESEEAAYRILEQLQRTFCFLEHATMAYFDPRPLIEACKTLNLNYNIYHQNDASEFCDQLLDRLETAMRGKHTGVDVWKDNVLTNIFGGGMLYQKIPEECEFYEADRLDCGHWQSTREEAFLKAELIIRGKEDIEESLEQLVEGELMNGDNKIMCEKCNQKKDTMRRTCFDILPNTMIIHLKRFDLDFQTFETVKLNNKIAFPTRLSMFKYTKEGMEAEEKAKIFAEEAGGAVPPTPEMSREMSDPVPPPPPSGSRSNSLGGPDGGAPAGAGAGAGAEDFSEYEYELQGVLVHAGMAQGGHYYSFIREISEKSGVIDAPGTDSWYRFEDEDVSTFNPDNIPSSCYGGTYSTSTVGMHDIIEEDRSANALMLFYRKVKPNTRESRKEEATTGSAGAGAGPAAPTGPSPEEQAALNARDPLVNGYHAFEREVWETNMKHLVAEYVLDVDLHNFVRSILYSICKGSGTLEQGAEALSLAAMPAEIKMNEIASFGCGFFMDVVLRCKERSGVKLWLGVLISYFNKFPLTADWFLLHIRTRSQCLWLEDYLVHCSDSMASSSFVQLVVAASLSVVEHASKGPAGDTGLATLRVLAVADRVLELLPRIYLNSRTADEFFIALRDLSSIPCVAEHFVKKDLVAKLTYFAIPGQVPAQIRAVFAAYETPSKDFGPYLQTVFEVIAVLLGIPQTRKRPLVEENPKSLLSQLTEEAVAALTIIFKENSTNNKMDFRDVLGYMVKVFHNQKQANLQARSILDRFGDRNATALYLDGFLLYYVKNSIYNPKLVWKDLHHFGFQNDLKRPTISGEVCDTAGSGALAGALAAVASSYSAVSDHLVSILPPASRDCLLKLGLYEAGMYEAEACALAVSSRVCFGDEVASQTIMEQVRVFFLYLVFERLCYARLC
jgi:ubiquitin C-terminal hydrolase